MPLALADRHLSRFQQDLKATILKAALTTVMPFRLQRAVHQGGDRFCFCWASSKRLGCDFTRQRLSCQFNVLTPSWKLPAAVRKVSLV